jgi:hypothetical protein
MQATTGKSALPRRRVLSLDLQSETAVKPAL